MIFDLMTYTKLCAPKVAPSTMIAIIKTESKGNHLAINLNHGYKLSYQAKSLKQAKAWVNYLDSHNYDFDVGLAQVNIRNIRKYGYKPSDMLDPCKNLKVASDILYKNYHGALNGSGDKYQALQQAISAYNTGNYHSGFNNGYVQKVLINGGVKTNSVSAIKYTLKDSDRNKLKQQSLVNRQRFARLGS